MQQRGYLAFDPEANFKPGPGPNGAGRRGSEMTGQAGRLAAHAADGAATQRSPTVSRQPTAGLPRPAPGYTGGRSDMIGSGVGR